MATLPTGKQTVLGIQMLFVAFGALVLVPLLTGLDPSIALFTAGAGTLLFHAITGGKVLTGTSIIERGVVVMDGSTIVSVGTGPAPAGALVAQHLGAFAANRGRGHFCQAGVAQAALLIQPVCLQLGVDAIVTVDFGVEGRKYGGDFFLLCR